MRPGEILNHSYQIVREIGSGGGGIVYKAYHIRLQKYIVVKKIKDNFVGRLDSRGEVDILKRLRHKYLPQVYDFVQRGPEVYTVMDFIDGRDLEYYISHSRPFSERQLWQWMYQLAEVLEYLHDNHIIHSDIKPGNIMITPDGKVCLIDFNISLDGEQDKVLGLSYHFAAPEQLQKAYCIQNGMDASHIRITPRIDIFSLGAVFYQMITGHVPERDPRKNIPLLRRDTCYSEGFIRIVDKCMQQEPSRRFRKAGDIIRALYNIEKQDSGYRVIMRCFALGMALSAMVLTLGIGLLSKGLIDKNRENFQRDCQELVELAAAYENQKLIILGSRMIHENAYQRFYDQDVELYAGILYEIGQGYRHSSNTSMASIYMKYACDASKSPGHRSKYYLGWVEALLETGDMAQVQEAIYNARIYGLGEGEISYIQAQLAQYKEEYAEATSEYIRALEYIVDSDERSSIYRQLGELYWQLGAYEESISMLEQAAACQMERNVLRELAQCCMELSETTMSSAAAREYQLQAISLYEQLNVLPSPAFIDKMNLAVLYLVNGQYHSAQTVLELLLADSSDYRVPMYLTYVTYELEDGKQSSYYEQALAAYRRQGSPSDDNMAQLMLLMEDKDERH